MKKLSLKDRILRYLERRGEWVNGRVIEELAMQKGYKASQASRRCREMVTGKDSRGLPCPIVLEREERKSSTGVRSVWYRALSQKKKVGYYITLPNGERELVGQIYE